jgi:tRNA A37 threonylcarbamoyladenosine biosynthesis protein TsaE
MIVWLNGTFGAGKTATARDRAHRTGSRCKGAAQSSVSA